MLTWCFFLFVFYKKKLSPKDLELRKLRYHVETTVLVTLPSAWMREYLAFCILNSFSGRPTIFEVVLQASQDDYRCGGHNKDTLGSNGAQKQEGLPLKTALDLGDGLTTRRRLGGFSLLSAPSGAKRADLTVRSNCYNTS